MDAEGPQRFQMSNASRSHILGIDDGPFEKRQRDPVQLVAVMMEGGDLVESVAMATFPVDGDGATDFLADWVLRLRSRPSIQGIVLGGITIAGLGIVDIRELAARTRVPVASITRRDPATSQLNRALESSGLADRLAIVERSPRATRLAEGLFAATAGAPDREVHQLVRSCLGKSRLPEPLRVAHLIARATVAGESKGRV